MRYVHLTADVELVPTYDLKVGDTASPHMMGPTYEIGGVIMAEHNGVSVMRVEVWETMVNRGRRTKERSEIYVGADHSWWRIKT